MERRQRESPFHVKFTKSIKNKKMKVTQENEAESYLPLTCASAPDETSTFNAFEKANPVILF
jgi:alkyl hydroperoxide reductase subunit AhpF